MVPEFQAYVGPRPFEEKDEGIFFGRAREVRDLLSTVIAHRLVLVYAQSGAGKTSIINAGLIPLLKENRLKFSRWRESKAQFWKIQKLTRFRTYMSLIHSQAGLKTSIMLSAWLK
ncbi:nSTAND1 domain-containing NTPase [Methanosarcina barkeri]|uniref:nSTAND1 domain-containing NTPase n=1 Tax=Methanosarcina barkeri TaxID=2208 RepID=UPI0006CF6B71